MNPPPVSASKRALKIVVMGTGPFAVPMFQAILQSPHTIAAVVTRPAHAPAGRRPPPNPMRDAATAAGVPILAPERINDPEAIAAIHAIGPDLLVAMPTRNQVLVFSKQDDVHLRLAERIINAYLSSNYPVSREIFALKNGNLRSLGVLE
jgi:hypothetical protein